MPEKKIVLDSDMPSAELDSIKLSPAQSKKGLIQFLLLSALGIFVFFFSVPVGGGETEIVFSVLYNAFVNLFGNFAYWLLVAIVGGNFCLHVYYKYVKKGTCTSALANVYANDGIVKTILYALGLVYVFLYALKVWIPGFNVEVITGAATGESVVPPIVLGVVGIILVGAFFMPLLLNYGILELVGVLLEPIMRPLFKVPGKAALDAVSSFVSSSSLGVLITNRLWKKNVYTDKEMVAIMTGFSAVSIGFAFLVINTAGCGEHFLKIYALSFLLVFIMATIMIRIPPISKKKETYYDGRVQTDADRKEGLRYSAQTIPLGIKRGIKRAAISKGLVTDVKLSVQDSLLVLPQVITMLSAIGVTAMILAEYTPIFTWLGYIFQPLLQLCAVPDAAEIAASMPIGLAEMFLPVLIIQGKIATLSLQARAFVCIVSMVQIIFFSETATVMLATKSPIKFSEIIICFLERTLLAIPLAAICIHLFF